MEFSLKLADGVEKSVLAKEAALRFAAGVLELWLCGPKMGDLEALYGSRYKHFAVGYAESGKLQEALHLKDQKVTATLSDEGDRLILTFQFSVHLHGRFGRFKAFFRKEDARGETQWS